MDESAEWGWRGVCCVPGRWPCGDPGYPVVSSLGPASAPRVSFPDPTPRLGRLCPRRLSLRQPGPAWAEALPGLHGSSASSAPPSAFACLSQGRIPKKHLAPQAAPHPLRLRGPSCGPEHPPARGRRRAAGVHLALGAGPPALRPPFTRNTGLISPLHSRAPMTPAAPASPRGAGSDTRS